MLVIRAEWDSAPMPYLRSNRLAPSAVMIDAIFGATVAGEPTTSDPAGPISRRNDASVGGAYPRSIARLPNMSRYRGQNRSYASLPVAAICPGMWTPTG